ncbi:MAG: PEP-CTERM sorting domain-containing protein [Pyrinomonadaceae bacterium]|nr:PEP-CTERM sorting domain-containing protein [Phycisphaerales bacterium]
MHRTRVSLRFAVTFAGLLIALSVQPARAVTITSLQDNFDTLDNAKWSLINADFEAGTSTIGANANGQLTLTSTSVTSFWGGAVLQSVNTFASDKPTLISVDRVSQTGSGTAHRSALQIRQADGTYMMLSQNIGEGGWQTNANVAGTGANIASLDALDNIADQRKMTFAYIPLGGNNAQIVSMVDGFVVDSDTFAGNWENGTDFNVRVAGLSRQAGDTVTATFDNVNAKVMNLVAPIVTATPSAGAFIVSGNDLLTNVTPSIVGTLAGQEGTSANPAILTNGLFGTADAIDGAQNVAIGNNTIALTYALDLSSAPLGYDITEIAAFTGWQDGGRTDQDYIVLLSFVDDPGSFFPIANIDANTGDNSLKVSLANGGAVMASGVHSVRFQFLGQENGHVGYRELDVIGTATVVPEPASALLGAMGMGLLALRRKRIA